MQRLASLIVHRSRRILGLTAAITLVSLLMLFRMDFNADVASFVVEGNETGEAFAALQAKYDSADPINVIVSLTAGGTFEEPEHLAALARLRDELASVAGVRNVATVVPELDPVTGRALSPETIAAIPPELAARLVEASPLAELLLSPERSHALAVVTPADSGMSVARRLADVAPPTGAELTLSGNPVVFASVLDKLSLFLLLIPPVVMLLLVLTFYATIGDRRLSVLALVPAALGAIWTFGLIFGLGFELDIVTVIVPIFVVVMGSADGLHFVTHFQDSTEGADAVDRVRSALDQVGVPMLLTTVSTAAGFLSLLATGVRPIQQLGAFTAIGIVFAGVVSFFSLPALLSRLTIESRQHHALIGPRIVRSLQALVRTRVPAALVAIGLLAFAALTLPRLEVNPDQLFFFKEDDPVRLAFERTEELFGGATPLMGEFVFDPTGGQDQFAALQAASQELEAAPGVREVFSLVDLSSALAPETLAAVIDGRLELPVGDLVSDDGLRFLLLPSAFSTSDLRTWLDIALARPEIRVLTGMPVVWDEIARLVLEAQLVSLVVAFGLVTVLLFAAYRRVRQTLVSLIPIGLTVATMLGFVAVSGIQLNLLTAVIGGIVIGVGIDYAIHFVAAIDHARRAGPGYVIRALDRAGRPIVANALGIAVALSALWLSPLAIHPQVSMIMWVAMLTAAATALLVIPALLPVEGRHSPASEVDRVSMS